MHDYHEVVTRHGFLYRTATMTDRRLILETFAHKEHLADITSEQ